MAENEIQESKTAPYPVGYGKPPVDTRFQPGHAPLPGAGRPRKRPQTEANDDLLRSLIPEQMRRALNRMSVSGQPITTDLLKVGATWADAIALGLGKKAISGDATAAKELRESVEGKSMQRIEVSGLPENRQPEMVIVYASAVPGGDLTPEQLLEAIKLRDAKKQPAVIDVTPEQEKTDGEEK